MWLRLGVVDAETDHPPRIARGDVIDDQRDLVVGGDIAVLLARRHPVAHDVDGLQVLVVGESDRADLRSTVRLDGRQAAELGLAKVGDLVWLEDDETTVKPKVWFMSKPLASGKMGR